MAGLAAPLSGEEENPTTKFQLGKFDSRLDTRWPSACEYESLRNVSVFAQVQAGAVLHEEWPILLDGILASVERRRRLGADYNSPEDCQVESLPLARWARDVGNEWCWLASTAIPDGDEEYANYFHKRFDHRRAEDVLDEKLPKNIRQFGPTRDWRIPLVKKVCGELHWRAVGNPIAIEAIVQHVHSVGAKKGQGEGAVLGWRVQDMGPPDPWWALQLPFTNKISRPFSVRAAGAVGAEKGYETSEAALRPPYWDPPPEGDVGGPDVPKKWRTVLNKDTAISQTPGRSK